MDFRKTHVSYTRQASHCSVELEAGCYVRDALKKQKTKKQTSLWKRKEASAQALRGLVEHTWYSITIIRLISDLKVHTHPVCDGRPNSEGIK